MKKLIVITAVAILMAACANDPAQNATGVAEGGISPGNPSNMQEWRDMHGN